MAIQRRTHRRGEEELLDDEADIVEEGAPEGEGEEAVEPVRRSAPVDTGSRDENRRRRRVVAKKKAKEPGVNFETDDPLEKYDILLQSGRAATEIDIAIKRISGGPNVQDFIKSRPGNGQDLLEAVKTFHVQNGGMPSEYWLKMQDSYYKTILGQGRVALPDMRPQGAMPMPYYPQPQAPAPAPAPVQQAPAPAHQPEPPRNSLSDMEQAFDFFLRMTGRGQPQQQQPQQPAQPQAPVPAMPGNMGEMLRMFEYFESRMKPPFPIQPQPQQTQPAPQQTQPAQPMGMPTFPAPAGTQWMYDPRGGWVAVPVAAQEPRGYRPRPQFEQHEPNGPGPGLHRGQPGHFGPNGAPQRPKTAADMLRETMTTVRSAAEVMREFEEILPGSTGRVAGEEAPAQEDDDNPYRTQKIGEIDVLRDPEGEIAFWPSVAVNAPKAFKFLGETYEKLQKNAAEQRQREQQQQRQQRRVLPPGHIEVIPGQPVQVPDGFTAVVLDEEEAQRVMQQQQQPVVTPAPAPQSALPPAPQDVPPPITAQPEQQPRPRTWGLPIVPEGE